MVNLKLQYLLFEKQIFYLENLNLFIKVTN
jgi:hypothetical protein